jgi:DNA-binding MarR family transcriptional regulator
MSNARGALLAPTQPTLEDYRTLAEFRYQIRCFLSFSESAARAAGVEPQQHQLLLALKGLPVGKRATIRSLAERLCVAHHTTVELVDRLEVAGLAVRGRSNQDRREVIVSLTPAGESLLAGLSRLHKQQLQSVGPSLLDALNSILDRAPGTGSKRVT